LRPRAGWRLRDRESNTLKQDIRSADGWDILDAGAVFFSRVAFLLICLWSPPADGAGPGTPRRCAAQEGVRQGPYIEASAAARFGVKAAFFFASVGLVPDRIPTMAAWRSGPQGGRGAARGKVHRSRGQVTGSETGTFRRTRRGRGPFRPRRGQAEDESPRNVKRRAGTSGLPSGRAAPTSCAPCRESPGGNIIPGARHRRSGRRLLALPVGT